MRIGVIGGGVVGRATARTFLEYVEEVRVYDLLKERRTHERAETVQSDIVFVCLPTPCSQDGSLDTSYVDDFFAKLHPTEERPRNFVLRSTVPIGTTRKLAEQYRLPNLVHSPEFLTARCAVTDAHLPARNIVGDSTSTTWNAGQSRHPVADLYRRRFPGVPVLTMESDESEAVKLIQNSFFAVKVSFFNEANALCSVLGLDWECVLNATLADGRIAHSHTKVPGPDRKYGFGGSCLPKDLSEFVRCVRKAGMQPFVSQAALTRNLLDRERK